MNDQAELELERLIRSSDWLMAVLAAVRDERVPDAWTGAGVLRDLVWGERYGSGFRPGEVHDVDVAFFDPRDLSRARDDRVTAGLSARLPGVPWEARNQAAVHTWYAARFGGEPPRPLTSIADAVATWPETATAVAVRLSEPGDLEICAPLGAEDLLGGVWRWNPRPGQRGVRPRTAGQAPASSALARRHGDPASLTAVGRRARPGSSFVSST